MSTQVEIWRSKSRGLCSIKVLDIMGRESDKLIRGEKTFTITSSERQMNQWAAATPEQDMFRNGMFVLVKPTADTNMEEISSADSWTDDEIEDFVMQTIGSIEAGDDVSVEFGKIVGSLSSVVTLNRFKEEAAAQDLDPKLRDEIAAKIKAVDPGRAEVASRVVVDDRNVTKTVPESPS